MGNSKPKIVYELTNKVTNEKYIGVTTVSVKSRMSDHKGKANAGVKGKLYESIATYGIENFEVKEIDTTYSDEELAQLEKQYISKNKELNISLNSDSGGGINKPVYKYSLPPGHLEAVYSSLESAARDSNSNVKAISRACLNERTKVDGYYWSYKKYNRFILKSDRRVKRVNQFTASGRFLNSFDSVSKASKITGVYRSSIAKVCRGERNTAGGFLWGYDSE